MLSLYLAALESDGDKKQFRELYRRYHRVMERTALAVLHDPHDAEEAVQEAFLRVIENFSKIYENYICLFNYLFISSQMSAKPYFIGSTGILLLW